MNFFRFFRSKHVRDFKVICAVALTVFLVHLILVLVFGVVNWGDKSATVPKTVLMLGAGDVARPLPTQAPGLKDSASAFFSFVIGYIGAAVPIYGIIIGWAYQSAFKRLGIVDLFACEISTLCRVGTILDMAQRYIDAYKKDTRDSLEWLGFGKFVSQEEYFTVFSNNSRDLQFLEASVVENITEFYTYVKAMRDLQRRLAEVTERGMQARDAKTDPWHEAIAHVLYLGYLSYESARKAIGELVEFEPAAAERKIAILITELKCYRFLLEFYKNDPVRSGRLKLREEGYKQEVSGLDRRVNSGYGEHQKDWGPAKETLPELKKQYKEALGEDMA